MDSSTQIVSALRVGGTSDQPVLKMRLKKCVLFICKTVDFNGEVSIKETSGACQKNYLLQTDLSRSGSDLTDVYDRLDVTLCFNRGADNQGLLKIVARAHRAPEYSAGMMQKAIYDLLQLQIKPMMKALSETLKVNTAKTASN